MRQRKDRHADKGEQQLEIVKEIYDIVTSADVIVHNRGKALSYLNSQKRKLVSQRQKPHQYGLARGAINDGFASSLSHFQNPLRRSSTYGQE